MIMKQTFAIYNHLSDPVSCREQQFEHCWSDQLGLHFIVIIITTPRIVDTSLILFGIVCVDLKSEIEKPNLYSDVMLVGSQYFESKSTS